jgi:hypothetical protein
VIDFDVGVEDEEAADGGGASDAAICWMSTRAWREMLKVEVCVIRNKVSMCLFRL